MDTSSSPQKSANYRAGSAEEPPLNARLFEDKRWEERARGRTEDAAGWRGFNGGIEAPERVSLHVGRTYHRFADGRSPSEEDRLGSEWWIDADTLRIIADYARAYDSPRNAARHLLGLPWDWSDCDRLVSAVLARPLDAYCGRGRPARGSHPADRGTTYSPPPELDIHQLYIPGMKDLWRQAFPDAHIENIWSSTYFSTTEQR